MNLEKASYKGLENCLCLANSEVELIITLDIGPRVIRFGFINEQNLFKEFDNQIADAKNADEWQSYGGHRLWHAPEVFPRTYAPDNEAVEYHWNGKTLTLKPAIEQENMIQKEIDITLSENMNKVVLEHRIVNKNVWGIDIAPWCLTVMAPGGRAIVPQEVYIPHGAGENESFVPARPLVLWHFTKMNDPRFIWGEKYIQLKEDSTATSKQKIGVRNAAGWAAYSLGDDLFIKKCELITDVEYPDYNSNFEFYTEAGFLEVETLGPMTHLEPEKTVEHVEEWLLVKETVSEDETDIDKLVLPCI